MALNPVFYELRWQGLHVTSEGPRNRERGPDYASGWQSASRKATASEGRRAA